MGKPLYTLEVCVVSGLLTDDFIARNPVVSRTIEIRADQTLEQLHKRIFMAFNRWDDWHVYEFQFGDGPHDRSGDRYVLPFVFEHSEEYDDHGATGRVDKTKIGDLNLHVGQTFGYWFAFEDNWYHQISVLAIGEADPKKRYPRIVARAGSSPPQYPILDDEEDG